MAAAGILANGVTEILKKLSSVLANEITLVWDSEDELKNLQSTLNMIMDVMEDAEKKQLSQAAVRRWMEELKAIAYDAEDILDDYSYEIIRKRTQARKVHKLSLFFRWRMAHKIKEINEKFNKIAKRKNDLGLQTILDVGSPSSHELMMKNRETYSLVNKDLKFVGRENDKSKIINTSLDQNSGLVIPIVGLGGMGKTTLAQQVYNDPAVEKHFDIKVWVCVSHPFDIKKLLKNIASSVGTGKRYGDATITMNDITLYKNNANSIEKARQYDDATNMDDITFQLRDARQCDDATNMDDIACQLRDALRGNKLLLVLDDVWNENFEDWRKLKTPLMFGAEGSKILVTTRSIKVAELMEDKFPYYELGILNDNDSWSLFKEIAFGSAVGPEETPNLVEIGKEMVKRCGGLPLAVVFLGSLMRSKKKEEEWKIVRDTKLWHESREGKHSEILPSLRLSYDYLPSHLKLCFSYCSLFAKDFKIHRETLIQLWMAEGFLIESHGENAMSMKEIGNEYFKNLLSNFFFQDAEKDDDGDIATCKMHDLVHDLARSVVGKNECLIVENTHDIDCISEATRRLSVLVNLDDEEMLAKVLEARKKAKNLRTLFVCQHTIGFDIGNAFKENKRLRVLNLSGSYFVTGSTTLSFTQVIDRLLNLRESSIGGLKHLRYLGVKRALFPKGIGRLSFLQTLDEFKVGDKKKNKNASVIEELEGLNLLTGDLSIYCLDNVTSGTDACRANLKEKKNLRGLNLGWHGGHANSNNHEAVLEGLRPHPNLRTLGISGFKGAKLPRWMEDSSCLPNLVRLELFRGIYEQVAGFGSLPSLRSLTLWSMVKLECLGKEFYYSSAAGGSSSTATTTTTAFPSLKKLALKFIFSLKEWVISAVPPPPQASTTTTGATTYGFPLLEEIAIYECPLLSTITPTTTIFPSLKVLNLAKIDGRAAKTLVTNNLNSLTTLRLHFIPKIISLPYQGLLENNNTLLSLQISYCQEFKGFLLSNSGGRGEGVVVSSTSSSSSLQSLKLYACPALRLLPNLCSLTSLKTLKIQECEESKSLQDELTCLSSSSLEHLGHVQILNSNSETSEEEVVVFEWRKRPSSFEE